MVQTYYLSQEGQKQCDLERNTNAQIQFSIAVRTLGNNTDAIHIYVSLNGHVYTGDLISEMTVGLYLCSSRWGLPARRHPSPGFLHLARGVESLPGTAESRHHDRGALVCEERTNTNKRRR